ncbi:MAG: TIGR00730 family Rossman fold protein [Clostridia bacterium]|nr:TIGR00730 family Rossman fold protein [Clostridia bacterium]
MNICVYGSASDEISPAYLAAGERLGEELARRGHTLIFGGGGRGLMGAAARGAHRLGGRIVGIAPTFFPDGAFSPYCTDFISTETMRERKQKMEDLSDAFIVTPGGIGTMEEFFEIYTLRHLGRNKKPITLLDTAGCFAPLFALLSHLVKEGLLARGDLDMLASFREPCALLDFLESAKEP